MSQISKTTTSSLSSTAISSAILQESQTSGTAGGTFTSGSFATRTLNDENDPDGIVTLSSNQFTLQNGTYFIFASAPAFEVNNHKMILVEDPSGTPVTVLVGSSERCRTSFFCQTDTFLNGILTVSSGPKTYEIQHRCAVTEATNGFGQPASFGESEIYTSVYIQQLA